MLAERGPSERLFALAQAQADREGVPYLVVLQPQEDGPEGRYLPYYTPAATAERWERKCGVRVEPHPGRHGTGAKGGGE